MGETQRPVTLVIGASGHLGTALARRLAQRGDHLVLAGRSGKIASHLAEELEAIRLVCDATDDEQVQNLVRQVESAHGRLDGMVNCAGSILLKPAHRTTPSEWQEVLAVNLTTSFHLLRHATPLMMRRQSGSIVLISSAAALRGLPNHEAIAAAKAGIVGLVRSAAASYASYGIRVNGVSPGMVESSLTASLLKSEGTRHYSTSLHALGRIGRPDDVASAVAWLLHGDQSWVTGEVMHVDGGLGNVQPRPSTGSKNSRPKAEVAA